MLLRGQLRPLIKGTEAELRFEFPATPVTLHTDEGKLMQVLRNLVSNAVKFTPRGEVIVSAAPVGDDVRFEVRDTGIGIAPEDLPRIFDEFVQIPGELQRSGQGTGLGLPLARKLIGLLGGELSATSQAGSGTTFTVTVPGAPGGARRRGAGSHRRGARGRRRRHLALRGRGAPARVGLADRDRVRRRGRAGGAGARACPRR